MFQILVAEDDKNTRRLMEAVLKEHGYHPILACDGLEALKLLDTHHVDLVILDIMMPGMDGYEFTRQLRATDYTRAPADRAGQRARPCSRTGWRRG